MSIVKRIKALKVQGAKVKGELESILLQIKHSEQNKENNCETIRRKLVSTIDKECREIKDIIIGKHLKLINHVNNIFSADKQKSSEDVFALKQQLDETIKDITHTCNDNGDLLLLEEAIRNEQNDTKVLPQLMEEKSLGVYNKFLKMQKSLEQSLENSKKTVNALQLSSEEVVKEIYSGQEQLSAAELSKIHEKLQTLKFFSYFDVKKTLEGLEVSMWPDQPKQIEVNERDFKEAETLRIKLGRHDLLMKELNPNLLTYIFRSGLEKLTSLKVSFDPKNFNRHSAVWLANIISGSVQHLKSLSLDFEQCWVSGDPLRNLCHFVFPKMNNLKDFGLYLNSSCINSFDLLNLASFLGPFCKNFERFALGLANNSLTDNDISQIYRMIQGVERLKNLQLNLSETIITDKSLEALVEEFCRS